MTMTHEMRRQALVVLILGALEGFLSQVIQVFQIPEVHAYEGRDVTLPCTYNISGQEEANTGSYKWYRHLVKTGTEVSDANKNFTGRISRVDTETFIKTRLADLTIHNVVSSDTGTYFCEVSFLNGGGMISGHGTGTLLNVTSLGDLPKQHSIHKNLFISLGAVFGVVVVVFILLLVGYCRICKQAPRSTVEASPSDYTEFTALGSRQNGGPYDHEMLQNVETSHYMMDNQQYEQFLPVQPPQKRVPSVYQEVDLYSVIP